MLPPVLEVYVVWHPEDPIGPVAAKLLFEHFHGTAFSGLIGGAVEVYSRSTGWADVGDAPRPIPFPDTPPPNGSPAAHIVVVVPLLGLGFARVLQRGDENWRAFVERIVSAEREHRKRVAIFPLALDDAAVDQTVLGELFGRYQRLAPGSGPELDAETVCRDLTQGITQLAAGGSERIKVFISHTKRPGVGEAEEVPALIRAVREVIAGTRLTDFFDAQDLQPGREWEDSLLREAATSALLALRTDLYASRTWCQREMLVSKLHGMPIVIIDALTAGEERGSFIMDHVPRVPARPSDEGWTQADIRRALNLLVDECLKRSLWRLQQQLAAHRTDLEVNWWAAHAPEPVTLGDWLEAAHDNGRLPEFTAALRILHPDPPLGPDERSVLEQFVRLIGHRGPLEVMTPRMLAARGA
jgi:hypothetical protein